MSREPSLADKLTMLAMILLLALIVFSAFGAIMSLWGCDAFPDFPGCW